MAINKNFVIKNGVEVNTNLLVGDSTLSKVGIATTVPGYTLHIGVGAGDRGGIGATDLTVTGVATIGTQNSTSGALNVGGISTFSGDIFVGSGATIQANGNAAFAGIGTFGGDLNVGGNLNAGDFTIDEITARNINVTGFATFSAIGGNLIPDTDDTHSIGAATSEWKDLFIDGTAKIDTLTVDESATVAVDVTVGTGVTLQRHGGGSFAGIVTTGGVIDANDGINAATAKIEDLTDNRVVIAGSGGELEDSGNLTFDGSTLAVTGQETVSVDVTVGTGVTLQRHGGVSIAGITTVGGNLLAGGDILPDADGSRDLGSSSKEFQDLFIDGTANIDSLAADTAAIGDLTNNRVVIAGSSGELEDDSNLTFDGSTFAVGVNANLSGEVAVGGGLTITGITTTGENLGGFKRLVGSASSTVVSIAVTVAVKTADHRYFGQGSANGYWLDGVQSPFLTLVPGKLYYFDQSHSTNSGHPFRFYLEQDKANSYTTEITTGGTPGSSGAYTQIGIGTGTNENNHPAVLYYQCSQHGFMGNAVATQSNVVNLPDSVNSTVRGDILAGSDSQHDIGSNGTRFANGYFDTLYGDGSNLTNLPTQVSIANNADNRVITGGSGVNLNGEANLTFDGTTLGVTGSIDLSADIDVDGTANLDVLDVDGASNFGADVVFAGAGSTNITFDQSTANLVFDDNSRAVFGDDLDLEIFHDSTTNQSTIFSENRIISIMSGNKVEIEDDDGINIATFQKSGGVEISHNATQTLFTTGIGITVGLTTLQRNGNAAFAGITTVGDILDVNGRIDAASGANISGIATITNAYITKLAQGNGTSGNTNEVPVANGSGGWNWQPVNTTGAGDITGITVREEGSNVGTANSITVLNFVGNDVTADATENQGICTVTIDSNIAGINTLGGSFFHDIQATGVTTITSDSQTALNVGAAATLFANGNAAFAGIVTANGGVNVGAAVSVHTNGNAAFAGIVTAGGGFNIGIQSAGIVIAQNVGINTLNFVGSGNSITYFAATNTLDVSIAGSSGGGGGGVSETETAVSSTSATSTGSFAKASFRSASILAQITQGSAFQVGRYLLIHDGTTVTTIEESAVATGSMLGTFEGVINGSDVEFRVTMSSSSSATVTTKIDTISIP